MPAYVVFDEDVTDLVGIQEYIQQSGPVLERYGGKPLAPGGPIETLEGDWRPNPLVILEFESVVQARRWYSSNEHTRARTIRHLASNSRVVLVPGVTYALEWPPKTPQHQDTLA